MKIYCNRHQRENELDRYIGKHVWIRCKSNQHGITCCSYIRIIAEGWDDKLGGKCYVVNMIPAKDIDYAEIFNKHSVNTYFDEDQIKYALSRRQLIPENQYTINYPIECLTAYEMLDALKGRSC